MNDNLGLASPVASLIAAKQAIEDGATEQGEKKDEKKDEENDSPFRRRRNDSPTRWKTSRAAQLPLARL